MKCVAIDFETANDDLISACSVGLAEMEGERVIRSYYTLLTPASPYFSPKNSAVHGLSEADVAGAPTFSDVWPTIREFIGESLTIAHNAPFDIGIIKALLNHYALEVPPIRYTCTLKLARKAWPTLNGYSLPLLSSYFNFPYRPHHALDDAINCGLLFAKALPYNEEERTLDVLEELGIKVALLSGGVAPRERLPLQGSLL
ncbi:MAG: 3'-5' exonuclease [Sphaerochaetaceae bacterium]|jgi:DNA polymerase-3 subunit epsilon|nr:3'-5' exonuclease [Sphaerochaetaceae bacterium]HHU88678.1 3'-5' exonuclease [Spirochaetales bacterium]